MSNLEFKPELVSFTTKNLINWTKPTLRLKKEHEKRTVEQLKPYKTEKS
jgi:hypothetical protein